MTKQTTTFVYVTYIVSTPEKVFEAITKPDIARRYWGHENVSDWKPGSKWKHIRDNDERTVERSATSSRFRRRRVWSLPGRMRRRPPIPPPTAG